MPNLNGRQFPLYHGTVGKIVGGEIQPSEYGTYGSGVYSTTDLDYAESMATARAERSDIRRGTGKPDETTTRPLFGTVYEIDDMEATRPNAFYAPDTYLSPNPTKVKKAVSFPIADYARPDN